MIPCKIYLFLPLKLIYYLYLGLIKIVACCALTKSIAKSYKLIVNKKSETKT